MGYRPPGPKFSSKQYRLGGCSVQMRHLRHKVRLFFQHQSVQGVSLSTYLAQWATDWHCLGQDAAVKLLPQPQQPLAWPALLAATLAPVHS